MARPRGQRGQIKQHGSNWLFVYYLNGKRTHVVLAPVNVYPFRNPEQVREKFSPQISDLHRTANAEVPNTAMLDGLLTSVSTSNASTGSTARCASNWRVRITWNLLPSTATAKSTRSTSKGSPLRRCKSIASPRRMVRTGSTVCRKACHTRRTCVLARSCPACSQEILAKYRKDRSYPPVEGGWMFYGSKEKKPIDMDNLSRREIPQFINGAWRGWHAFRRGLGTRLNDMGMSLTNIQSILRHASISTTTAHYVFPNPDKTKAGLRKLAEAVRKTYKIKV